jgi:alkylated DNA repair dioxygenase AlkB
MILGLTYIQNFISAEEQDHLLDIIDHEPWSNALKRRTQHYGYKYDYTKKKIDDSLYLGPLPDWLNEYTAKLVDKGYFYELPDQVIVNEYLPKQGISKHVDCVDCFTNTIASLSLLAPCTMDFEHISTLNKKSIFLEPQSLLVLIGEARYNWLHSIEPRLVDRRVSLTFRKIIK